MVRRTALLISFCAFVFLFGCKNEPEPVTIDRDQPKTKFEYRQEMPSGGELVDVDHGREVWLAVGAIAGVEDTPANGVAQAHYYEDGSFEGVLQLNINLPEDGQFYEAWLLNSTTNDMVSMGRLTTPLGDVRHVVQFTADADYRDYKSVVVTLEKDDGNPQPAAHVAEGLLKAVQR